MTVLFFGHYDKGYSRNRVIIKGLINSRVHVAHCNSGGLLVKRYPILLIKALKIIFKSDYVFVGFPGQTDVPLAWLLTRIFRKKLVYDPFVSMYDTNILDRKYFKKTSLRAKYYFFVDWLSANLADIIIFDTQEHFKYFKNQFRIKSGVVVPVGTDENIFKPVKPNKNLIFTVGFHGSFLPLQGVKYIIEAAKLVGDVKFRLLGDGMEFEQCKKMVTDFHLLNVEFVPRVAYEALPGFIGGVDVYLGGPFGDTPKAQRVIPNKVYEAMAVGKPILVGDTPAIREVFVNNANACFVKVGSGEDIARGIRKLKADPVLAKKLGVNARKAFLQNYTSKKISKRLVTIFSELQAQD